DNTWPMADRGLIFSRDMREERSDSFLGALDLGFKETTATIIRGSKALYGMVARKLAPKNLGGPVVIARASFFTVENKIWVSIYFLGLYSTSLAVLNLLPLPLLDGGELLLVGYEKLRGRPLSRRARTAAYCVGGVLLLILLWLLF